MRADCKDITAEMVTSRQYVYANWSILERDKACEFKVQHSPRSAAQPPLGMYINRCQRQTETHVFFMKL